MSEGPFISRVAVNSSKEEQTQGKSTSQPSVNTSQNSDAIKSTFPEKTKPGQPRGGTKHGDGNGYNITFSSSTGLQDLESIRKILNESLQGGQESIDQLSRKVQELIEGKEKDTLLIQQLKNETEELSRLLKEEKETNEKHRTSQAQKELERKDKEITDLRKETTELKQETEKLREEVEKLRTSLSKTAGEKLTHSNPDITDLSDPNRPQKLCEKFNSLYDNLWTDAFEHVSKSGASEKKCAGKLVEILKQCWDFCCACADRQFEILQKKLLIPEEISEEETRPGLTQSLSPKELKLIKETRKAVATHTLTSLKQFYWKTKAKQDEKLRPYVDACMEICWYGAVNDPKLHLNFSPEKNRGDFRDYTQTGKYFDFLVWPALLLNENGPVLYKGVVQMRNDQNEKEREQM